MVNTGPSTACQRCRERSTRCDRVRPGCGQCARGGIVCPGYRATREGLVFEDQSQSTTRRYSQRTDRNVGTATASDAASASLLLSSSSALAIDMRSTAVQYFFTHHVATNTRDMWLSRGHFDHLEALYRKASADSALAAATETMATCALLLHFGQSSGVVDEGKALIALQKALQDPDESLRDETLLAVLCLDYAQHLVAARTRRTPSMSHTNGAVILIEHRAQSHVCSPVSEYLLAATQSNLVAQNYWRTSARDQRALECLRCPPIQSGSPMMKLQRLILRTLQEARLMQHHHPDAAQSWREGRIEEQCQAFARLEDDLQSWSLAAPAAWKAAICDMHNVPRPSSLLPSLTSLNLHEAHICGAYLCIRLMVAKFKMVSWSTSMKSLTEKQHIVLQTRFIVERLLDRLFDILAYIKTLADITIVKDVLTRQLVDSILRLGPRGLVGGTPLDARLHLLSLSRWALSVLSFSIPGSESFGAPADQMSRLSDEFQEASRFMADATLKTETPD